MEKQKTAPRERGAEQMSMDGLLNKYGYDAASLAEAMNVDAILIEGWCDGSIIPNAGHAMEISKALGCKLDEVYLAIIYTPER